MAGMLIVCTNCSHRAVHTNGEALYLPYPERRPKYAAEDPRCSNCGSTDVTQTSMRKIDYMKGARPCPTPTSPSTP